MTAFTLQPEHFFNPAARSWAESEQRLIDAGVKAGGGIAWVGCGADGIVVPRSYRSKAGFDEACATLLSDGLPVHVRLTGGGVVPQSADVVNLQLVYPAVAAQPLQVSEQHYLMLCALLQKLFAVFGINTDYQTVSGSFCDGRFNLAHNGRKIAGTAQCWQRLPGVPDAYTVLSSAVILADNPHGLTERANLLETALGSSVRYLPEKTTAVGVLSGAGAGDVCAELVRLLEAETFGEGFF